MRSSSSDSSASSWSSSGSEGSESEDNSRERTANCIRNVANFSKISAFQLLDKKNFNPELLEQYLSQAAPKLTAMFERIAALDAKDMRQHGKHFKHMIFTDNKSSAYGAKIIASAFLSKGFHLTYHVQGTGFAVYPEETLMETKGTNVSLLMSKTVFDRPINVKLKKSLLEIYNRRPENVYGDLTRFIILDQGFKEGIDLFDVKYVHLFEPLVVRADEKQAIGRGTRFCGQRGLEFHPRYGWPLYVFRYEVSIPDKVQSKYLSAKQMFELYLKYADIDLRKVVFAAELEKAAIDASVDKELTQAVHQFAIEHPPPILQNGGALKNGGAVLRSSVPKPPTTLFNSVSKMQAHIHKGFKAFSYPKVVLENQCKDMAGGAMVQFTPTQDFIRHYFQPSSAYKGMLLWHSVGTGKTCSAIATASTSFEKEGYTILWVTRHTLKSDIWKNMFQWVCSATVQERLDDGSLVLPAKVTNPKRFAPPEWMEPISYKQFSNMLLQKNNIYNEIVRRNGKEDPLRKTLVIIDEAHKLYSPTVVGSEKPNTDILEKMVQHSYQVSGKDSVRLLAMTATPYTEDGMEMIKLLNLLRLSKDALPTDFDAFNKAYLDANGFFRTRELKHFQDDISGYISYLNRSQDARNFAHPVLEDVLVPLTLEPEETADYQLDENGDPILGKNGKPKVKKTLGKYEKEMKNIKERMKKQKEFVADAKKAAKKKCQSEEMKAEMEKCKELPVKERKPCKEAVKEKYADKACDTKQKDLKYQEDALALLKGEQQRVKEAMKEISDRMKVWREESKALTKEYKIEKSQMTKMKISVTGERKRIMKLKDKAERKVVLKAFRETKLKAFKAQVQVVKTMRARLSGIKEDRRLLRLQLGKLKLKGISQEKALDKKCKFDA